MEQLKDESIFEGIRQWKNKQGEEYRAEIDDCDIVKIRRLQNNAFILLKKIRVKNLKENHDEQCTQLNELINEWEE